MSRALLHPTVVEQAARALSESDEALALRADLTWGEMDAPEQDAFRRAVRVVLDAADTAMRGREDG